MGCGGGVIVISVSSMGKWVRAFLEVGNIGKRRKMMGSALDPWGLRNL